MTDKEINTNKYFVERTDIGGGTIGYTVPFPEELLREIIKQNKQLARKTQECEVLQEQNQKLQMQLCNECGERDDYNIPCKMIRDLDYWLQKEIEENDRYRKALEEIEKQCKCYGRSKYTQEFDREYGGELDTNILDIITKAKDGNNE